MLSLDKKSLQKQIPDIRLGRSLGAGGNANVYRGTPTGSKVPVAVKFLVNLDPKRYTRFCDEVQVVTDRLKASPHVLPILRSNFPATPDSTCVPWYSMPVATTLLDHTKPLKAIERFAVMLKLSEGLASLHENQVAHRDIKPQNLFIHDGRPCFGDFGIAKFPNASGVTTATEPMGPVGWIAPEMVENSAEGDAYKADVYSFAKTLWAVMVNSKKPFAGQYDESAEMAFRNYSLPEFAYESLEELLTRATSFSPRQRPTAIEFTYELSKVSNIQSDAREKNIMRWTASQRRALADSTFTTVRLEGMHDICTVLNSFIRPDERCHCFLPDGGGMDISSARLTESDQMLALQVDTGMDARYIYVVRPKALTLEKFAGRSDFGYLVLETDDVDPLGSSQISAEREYLWQSNDENLTYIEPDDNSERSTDEIECDRYFKASKFIFAPSFGGYNLVDDYMGTANVLDLASLRAHISKSFATPTNAAERTSKTQGVHLQRKVTRPAPKFSLRFLTQETFDTLLALDTELRSARNESPTTDLDFETMFQKMSDHLSSPLVNRAREVLKVLARTEQHEYMTLVNLARSAISISSFEQERDRKLNHDYEISYLLEKLGNGYLQRAKDKFAL